jgi:hypothetical protein
MRAAAVFVVLLVFGCGPWFPARQVRRMSIAWPLEAKVIRVESLPRDVAAQPIEGPPPALLTRDGCELVAYGAGASTPPSRLPAALAAILPTAPDCWRDGVVVAWDHEVCLVGGHVVSDGTRMDVDGGFCYAPETKAWRVVQLAFEPRHFGDATAGETDCRPVRVDGARALQCGEQTLRFDGLR